MRNNKILKAMSVVTPLMLSTSLMAATVTSSFLFTTVDDVAITPQQVIDFGDTILPIAGNTCTLLPDITTTAATIAGATFGATTISGGACNDAATDGQAAHFNISGAASTPITITLSDSDAALTDYEYSPVATFMNGTAGDRVDNINSSVSTTVALSAAGDAALVLGGELSINVDLLYGTDFTDPAVNTYVIDITY